jgi:hypothetical protein
MPLKNLDFYYGINDEFRNVSINKYRNNDDEGECSSLFGKRNLE